MKALVTKEIIYTRGVFLKKKLQGLLPLLGWDSSLCWGLCMHGGLSHNKNIYTHGVIL